MHSFSIVDTQSSWSCIYQFGSVMGGRNCLNFSSEAITMRKITFRIKFVFCIFVLHVIWEMTDANRPPTIPFHRILFFSFIFFTHSYLNVNAIVFFAVRSAFGWMFWLRLLLVFYWRLLYAALCHNCRLSIIYHPQKHGFFFIARTLRGIWIIVITIATFRYPKHVIHLPKNDPTNENKHWNCTTTKDAPREDCHCILYNVQNTKH